MEWDIYKGKVTNALHSFKFDEGILKVLKDSISKNQKIFVAGNGGSAAIALHYACDFSKGATENWEHNPNRLKVICLASNISYITAIANDMDYRRIFKEQLVNLASPNDILILISSSGNSPNIVEAAKFAKQKGLITIGITGFNGGQLKKIADYSAHIEFESYEVCEDVHGIFGHFLVTYLRGQSDINK